MFPVNAHSRRTISTLIACAALPVSAHAATTYPATRTSLDGIVGQTQVNGPTLGYYDGNPPSSTRIGGTGSSGSSTRYGQDIVYRYALPTLNPGEAITSFTLNFQITAFRDHAGNSPELDVYLLNTADPTTPADDSLFFRGDNDTANALVGSHFEDAAGNTGSITLDPDVDVTFTVGSGATLALLQSFYGGDHIPDQTEASFRFNLDKGDALIGPGLNRYFVNDDVTTSGFEITVVPEPSTALLAGLGLLTLLRRRI